ncbi:MAG TPA: M15 family metallopeptidase [Candidatus Acidoferrum sp.]|nr:M15 family metallopeptidase [Candidatus Acidoferrum sp.]
MSASGFHALKRSVVFLFIAAIALFIACSPSRLNAQTSSSLEPGPKPHDIPKMWRPWIGEYGWPPESGESGPVFVVSEDGGSILIRERDSHSPDTKYKEVESFSVSVSPADTVHTHLDISRLGVRAFHIGDVSYRKMTPDTNATQQVLIKPVKPITKLRAEALADSPPHEDGPFRKPELVELTSLDPVIHFDIRYATTNDFLGTPVYTQARAFMQRPAAEALVRALHKVQPLGYGLLLHDAYRPWYVTKIFWDATPPEGKIFVADPSQGSRHNRGCAVDLTLYDLATGKPIEMPGTYDEMSPRSFPDYPGGTSLQRWHRDLLRRAMESEGFTVYEHEWWHFDYKDWREYPILNIKFEDLHSGQGLASAN